MTADWPDDNPSAHRASAIYTQRVPLARAATSLGGNTGQTLLPSSSVTLFSASILDQPAFELTLSSQNPAGLASHPWTEAQFSWIDAVTTDVKSQRTYVNANGDGQKNLLRVQGPTRGDQLTFVLHNDDTVNTLTFDWSLSTISHVILEDNVANDLSVPVHGFSLPGGDAKKGVIAASNPTLANGASVTRLVPARNGHVKITIDNSAGVSALQVTVSDPDPVVPLYGLTAGAEFYTSGPVPANTVKTDDYVAPPGPTLLTLTNVGTLGAISPVVVIAQFGGN